MKPPEPPIFVWDPNDLSAFESVEDAERYLEAIDVENGVYKAVYDAQGCLLKLLTVENPRRFTGGKVVHIEPAEEQPTHMAELEAVLRQFITAVGRHPAEWLEKATAKQLIETAATLAKTK